MTVACYCGAVFSVTTDAGRCPYCGVVASLHPIDSQATVPAGQIAEWVSERREIVASVQYAYAMGHGCSMGFLPSESRAVLDRKADLDALIAEHTHPVPTQEPS